MYTKQKFSCISRGAQVVLYRGLPFTFMKLNMQINYLLVHSKVGKSFNTKTSKFIVLHV